MPPGSRMADPHVQKMEGMASRLKLLNHPDKSPQPRGRDHKARSNMKTTIAIIAVAIAVTVIALMKNERMIEKKNSPGDEWPPEIVAKVNSDRAARQVVQHQNPELFAAVTAAMFRIDPIGINFETNTDEYDAEAGTVIPRLRNCSSSQDVAAVLHEEFTRWFGSDTAGERPRYEPLAEQIWTIWNKHKTEGIPPNDR